MVAAFAAVATAAPVGVSVNGVTLDSGGSSGEGWKYYAPHITLTNAGPFTISGTNELGQVRVVVQQGVTCDVTLSNLTLQATSYGQCAFTLETGAGSRFSWRGRTLSPRVKTARVSKSQRGGRSPSPMRQATMRAR
jgi:hypothetical protein